MQFNSYSFLLCLLPVVALYWTVPAGWRRWYLLVTSLLFYASWSLVYAPLPLVICGVAWFCTTRMLERPAAMTQWLQAGICVVLAILVFFKYRHFLLNNLNAILQQLGQGSVTAFAGLALPLGISFYTFEAISYLIDTRQGRVKDVRFLDLSLFVSFWPHLIAGPIVRVRELIPQLHAQKPFVFPMLVRGLDRLIWGLVQKNLFANNLSPMIDEGFLPQAARANSTLDNWALAIAFGLQIYFDFAAYSNMAIGSAQLLGITLPENFRYPYHAANPPDFWSRWHMTLSRWIRDYLFFPINAKYKGTPRQLYLSLLGIMALVGLWHGAGWGFVLWGLMHGIYLVLFRVWESLVEHRPAWGQGHWGRVAWRVFTVGAVSAAWIPFRAASLEQAAAMLKTMLVGFRFQPSYSVNFYLLTGAFAFFCFFEPFFLGWLDRQERRLTERSEGWSLLVLRPLVYAAGLFMFLIFDDRDTQFIYFQF